MTELLRPVHIQNEERQRSSCKLHRGLFGARSKGAKTAPLPRHSWPSCCATRRHRQATAAFLSRMCTFLLDPRCAHHACTTRRDRARGLRNAFAATWQRPRPKGPKGPFTAAQGRALPNCSCSATLTHLAMVACGIQVSQHSRVSAITARAHRTQGPFASCRHKHHCNALPMRALRQARCNLGNGTAAAAFHRALWQLFSVFAFDTDACAIIANRCRSGTGDDPFDAPFGLLQPPSPHRRRSSLS